MTFLQSMDWFSRENLQETPIEIMVKTMGKPADFPSIQ